MDAMDFWSFAAAAANVVMQMARPGVGYGVVESKVDSGSILKHPWKRARTTFQYLAVGDFRVGRGPRGVPRGGRRRTQVRQSTAESPVKYNAFDRDLQMWVAACLFVGLEDTYQLLRGEMTAGQAEQFYRSAWTLGTTCRSPRTNGRPPEPNSTPTGTPPAGGGHRPAVRDYLIDLVNLRMINPVLGLPFRPLLKFLTVGFLAPVFRDALGVKWSEVSSAASNGCFLLVAFVNRFLPCVHLARGGSFIVLGRRPADALVPTVRWCDDGRSGVGC